MRQVAKWMAALLIIMVVIVTILFLTGSPAAVAGVRYEEATALDPDDKPLSIRIWYPADLTRRGTVPLIVISHGTGGSSIGHADTAIALAEAGFVVVAMDHTGDNYRDTSYVGLGKHFIGRPRHVSRAIDFMLGQWAHRTAIDPARIGMFGHSAGAFTALVVAGAEPHLSRGKVFCRERPQSWTCRYLRRNGLTLADLTRQRKFAWHHDPRVKAIVIAAPAVGYTFDKANLAGVRLPVQLWTAGKDDVVEDSPATIRTALTAPTDYHLAQGAGHFSFLSPCDARMRAVITVMHWFGTEAICKDPAGFDRTHFHQGFNASVVRFFDEKLGH